MRPRLKRKTRGTKFYEKKDDEFICGFCINSGVAETTEGRLVLCNCNQPIVRGAD